MKKSLFALALAGALAFTAAQAKTGNENINAAQYTKGTTFYGTVRLGIENGKNHARDINDQFGYSTGYVRESRGFNVESYGSRLGFKGGEELGNGLWAIYHLEWGFDAAGAGQNGGGFNNRLAFLGLHSADIGTFTIGRQDNPYFVTAYKGSVLDQYYSSAGTSSAMIASQYVLGGGDYLNNGIDSRVGKSIAYTSPNWGGFDFALAAIMDKGADFNYDSNEADIYATNRNRGVDAWTAALNYRHESGFVAGATYMQTDYERASDAKRPYAYAVKLGYETEQVSFLALYSGGQQKLGSYWTTEINPVFGTTYSAEHSGKRKASGWDLGASYSFGPDYASTIRANFGQAKLKTNGYTENKVTTWAIGFEQDLSSRTAAFVEYGNRENKFENTKFKEDQVAVGIRHDF